MAEEAGVAGRDITESKQWAVAPSLAFGLGTPARVTFGYLHAEQNNIPDYGIPWVPVLSSTITSIPASIGTPGGQPKVDQSNWYGLVGRDYEDITNDVATASLERDLGPDTTLRNVSRYAVTERESVITAPRFMPLTAAAPGVLPTQIRRSDEKTRDQTDRVIANNTNLTKTFATGSVTHFVSTGLELTRETSLNHVRVPVDSPEPHVPTDLFNPNPYQAYPATIRRNGAYVDTTADNLGLYLVDTLELSEKWELNGGLRYDHFEVDYLSVAAAPALTPTRYQTTDDMLSWKTGLVFKPRANG
jgi:catecholate siderophore receptor